MAGGKHILEVFSRSMYIDPMTIYREYVQNAANAIDDARAGGHIGPAEAGKETINIDPAARSARITRRRTACGIGYCREPIFRSRTRGETEVSFR